VNKASRTPKKEAKRAVCIKDMPALVLPSGAYPAARPEGPKYFQASKGLG